jgi:ethanolamine ammonia-lyase small subunit
MTVPSKEIERGWARLRAATSARIGLSRSGSSISTLDHLAFQRDHAQARDAVHAQFDAVGLTRRLLEHYPEVICLHSAAADRRIYLARPDLGRRLNDESLDRLKQFSGEYDLLFVLADGLSPRAVTTHALPLLDQTIPRLLRAKLKIGPIIVVEQGRVAIGDEIGQVLASSLIAVLIGERPGLTSPDSLGVYLTWNPIVGRTDAERNCVSNIRPAGLPYIQAASRLMYLCVEASRRKYTGVELKDESERSYIATK